MTAHFKSIEMQGAAVPTRIVEGAKLIEHKMLLGRRRMIADVERALIGMSPRSCGEVMIPPHLGYDANGLGELTAPNTLFNSRLRVHDVQPAALQWDGADSPRRYSPYKEEERKSCDFTAFSSSLTLGGTER